MCSTVMPTPDRRRPELLARLPELRARLEEQRRFLTEQLTGLETPLSGDARTDSELQALLADANRRALGDVEVALHRMATGRYGTCLYCGVEIPLARLIAVPQVDACADCVTPDR
jgi:RNA polymerase-binding transcription factor